MTGSLWQEARDFIVWLVGILALGFLTLLAWIGNREMGKIDHMQNDWMGREEIERRISRRDEHLEHELREMRSQLNAIYMMLANGKKD